MVHRLHMAKCIALPKKKVLCLTIINIGEILLAFSVCLSHLQIVCVISIYLLAFYVVDGHWGHVSQYILRMQEGFEKSIEIYMEKS